MNFSPKSAFLGPSIGLLCPMGRPPRQPHPPVDKAAAYYNFSMGHLYAELAGVYGNRSEYVGKAIDYYKQALKLDPGASFLFEELTDLYIQSGRLKDAVTEAEDILKREPNNLDARRILGRIYTRMIGDAQQGKINEEMLRAATEQYEKITAKDPKDIDSWLTLGRLYRTAAQFRGRREGLFPGPGASIRITRTRSLAWRLFIPMSAIPAKPLKSCRPSRIRIPIPARWPPWPAPTNSFTITAAPPKCCARPSIWTRRTAASSARWRAICCIPVQAWTSPSNTTRNSSDDDPHDTEALLRMAEIYREKRDFTKAREILDKAKASDPENLEVRYDEVNLLAVEGQTDKAIEALKALLKDTERKTYSESEKGTRVNLLDRLGELYRGANQNQAAIDTFRQIADLDPDSGARAAAQIVDTYRAAKDFKNAARGSRRRAQEVSGRSRVEARARLRAGRYGQSRSGRRRIARLAERRTRPRNATGHRAALRTGQAL